MDGLSSAIFILPLRARRRAPSPLEGEGWGGGWRQAPASVAYPPPCPSPSRGKGTMCQGSARSLVRWPSDGSQKSRRPQDGAPHVRRWTIVEPEPFLRLPKVAADDVD